MHQCIPPRHPIMFLKKCHSCCFFCFFFPSFSFKAGGRSLHVEQVHQSPTPSRPIPLRPVSFHPDVFHSTSSHPVSFHAPLAATRRATRTSGRVWQRLSWRRRWGGPRSPRRWRVPSRSWRCPRPTTSRARRSAWTVGPGAAGARDARPACLNARVTCPCLLLFRCFQMSLVDRRLSNEESIINILYAARTGSTCMKRGWFRVAGARTS